MGRIGWWRRLWDISNPCQNGEEEKLSPRRNFFFKLGCFCVFSKSWLKQFGHWLQNPWITRSRLKDSYSVSDNVLQIHFCNRFSTGSLLTKSAAYLLTYIYSTIVPYPRLNRIIHVKQLLLGRLKGIIISGGHLIFMNFHLHFN